MQDAPDATVTQQVCERWIYSSCLCFALDLEEQKRSGFHYNYSVYQVEYSRNYLFAIPRRMEEVFQVMIDRTRRPLDIPIIRTLFGASIARTGRLGRSRLASKLWSRDLCIT